MFDTLQHMQSENPFHYHIEAGWSHKTATRIYFILVPFIHCGLGGNSN